MSKFKNSTARTLYLVAHTNKMCSLRRSPCVWLVDEYLRLPSAGSSSRSVLMMINDWADLCVVSLLQLQADTHAAAPTTTTTALQQTLTED